MTVAPLSDELTDDPTCNDLSWLLGVLLRALHKSTADVLCDLPHGPRGFQVLSNVVHGNQPSQLALAEHLGIDRTVMTYLIDDLVDARLVERRLNPADRRQRQVVATEEGRQILTSLKRQVRQRENEVLDPLSPDERRTVRILLQRAACNNHSDAHTADVCAVVRSAISDGGA